MREVLDELMGWWEAGETVGVGTVVATFRSAPRPPGAPIGDPGMNWLAPPAWSCGWDDRIGGWRQ